MTERPNIIYIICHDLGKHLGCYDAMVDSPNMDRLASEGVKFNKAFCNAPACSPARACAITGKYSHTNGEIGLSHMGWSLAQDQRTVVDCFNDGGYETVHFGLNHERHAGTNHYQIDEERTWGDWNAANAVDKTIEYLENRPEDPDQPFYLNVGFFETHAPWAGKDHPKVALEDVYIPTYCADVPFLREKLADFQGSILYMDAQIGRLRDAIDRMGYRDNTILMFTTDHGIDNLRAKGTLYDSGVEVSLLMQLPVASHNGVAVDELIQHIDIAPTLLNAAGIDVPTDMQGKSFWPLLIGESYQPHTELFIERNFHGQRPWLGDHWAKDYADVYDPIRAVRTKDFHYIRNFDPGAWPRLPLPHEIDEVTANCDGYKHSSWPHLTGPRPEEELYHITHDPAELRNVATQTQYAAIKQDLADRLEAWMRQTDDHILTGNVPARPEEPGWGNFPIE
ncbi:MAG TPA: hypothetical protein ENL03_06180 [Phycisphaerae bacterium]|nr:hypothetical protein [Phycisphaerae bacterium]